MQVKEAHGQCAILEAKERESATELKAVKSELTSAVARDQEQVVALAASRRELEACKSELEACKIQLQTSEEARKVDKSDLEQLKGLTDRGEREGEELSVVKKELSVAKRELEAAILNRRLYMYVCMYVCMYLSLSVCVCVCIYI